MGFGFPAALGAQFGCPDKKVWAVVGDGGFQMTQIGTRDSRIHSLPDEMPHHQQQLPGHGSPVAGALLREPTLGRRPRWQSGFREARPGLRRQGLANSPPRRRRPHPRRSARVRRRPLRRRRRSREGGQCLPDDSGRRSAVRDDHREAERDRWPSPRAVHDHERHLPALETATRAQSRSGPNARSADRPTEPRDRQKKDLHTISLLVRDAPGVLVRVAMVFSRRGYNIESLVVSPGARAGFSRMTVDLLGRPRDPRADDQTAGEARRCRARARPHDSRTDSRPRSP